MCGLQTGDEREQVVVVKFEQSADGHARLGWPVGGQAVKVKAGRDYIYSFLLENKERGERDIGWGAGSANVVLYTYRSDDQFSISAAHCQIA